MCSRAPFKNILKVLESLGISYWKQANWMYLVLRHPKCGNLKAKGIKMDKEKARDCGVSIIFSKICLTTSAGGPQRDARPKISKIPMSACIKIVLIYAYGNVSPGTTTVVCLLMRCELKCKCSNETRYSALETFEPHH